MEKKRVFKIISDIHGTFDTDNAYDLIKFVNICKQIQNDFACDVHVHFVSGTISEWLERTVGEYLNLCPELKPFLHEHVVRDGLLTTPLGKKKNYICGDKSFYDKSYATEYILNSLRDLNENVVGCCYAGNGEQDRIAFDYMQLASKHYPLNATPIIVGSFTNNIYNNTISQKESKLIGVNEGLVSLIEEIKNSKVAQDDIKKNKMENTIKKL